MKITHFAAITGTLALSLSLAFCKKNNVTTVTCDGTASTYNSNIKAILDGACTASGCHPNYTSYSELKSVLSDGQFKSHVLTKQDMPQNKKLSADQLTKIQCWADAGFPEK